MLQTQWRKQHWPMWLECRKIILFFPYLNIYYLLKPLQIYGILLNICGILLNNRGKTEKNGEFRGILWNFHGKYVENHSFLFHFFPQPLAGWPIFAVVFGHFRSFLRSFLEKIGEFRRKMENIGEIFPFSFLFFPLHYTFIPFYSSTPRFSSPNVKSYWI